MNCQHLYMTENLNTESLKLCKRLKLSLKYVFWLRSLIPFLSLFSVLENKRMCNVEKPTAILTNLLAFQLEHFLQNAHKI